MNLEKQIIKEFQKAKEILGENVPMVPAWKMYQKGDHRYILKDIKIYIKNYITNHTQQ